MTNPLLSTYGKCSLTSPCTSDVEQKDGAFVVVFLLFMNSEKFTRQLTALIIYYILNCLML